MATKNRASAAMGLSNLAQSVGFALVEVLAALQLSGWLSWLLWLIAARNVVITCFVLYGAFSTVADKLNEETSA